MQGNSDQEYSVHEFRNIRTSGRNMVELKQKWHPSMPTSYLGSVGSPLTKLKTQEQELIFRVSKSIEVQIIYNPGQATF